MLKEVGIDMHATKIWKRMTAEIGLTYATKSKKTRLAGYLLK